jgi:hypothetical protein
MCLIRIADARFNFLPRLGAPLTDEVDELRRSRTYQGGASAGHCGGRR